MIGLTADATAVGPYVTDENNYILDCHLGQIPNAGTLARVLSDMPGADMASAVLVWAGLWRCEGER